MSENASRARLLALREEREGARRGKEVLEEKLELLRRAFRRRASMRDESIAALAAALASARGPLRDAQVELGRAAVEAAALAQPSWGTVQVVPMTLAGIAVPRFVALVEPFRPRWGTGGGAPSLDRAAAAFAAVLPLLILAAEHELAVKNLGRGLKKTIRRLNALEKAILPALEQRIRTIVAALEEEERDESLRRDRWLAASRASPAIA